MSTKMINIMMVKQMRELERQSEVLENSKIMKVLNGLKCYEDLYYVGEMYDDDRDGWVDKEKAIDIIREIIRERKNNK
jgi:hypothetical protein